MEQAFDGGAAEGVHTVIQAAIGQWDDAFAEEFDDIAGGGGGVFARDDLDELQPAGDLGQNGAVGAGEMMVVCGIKPGEEGRGGELIGAKIDLAIGFELAEAGAVGGGIVRKRILVIAGETAIDQFIQQERPLCPPAPPTLLRSVTPAVGGKTGGDAAHVLK